MSFWRDILLVLQTVYIKSSSPSFHVSVPWWAGSSDAGGVSAGTCSAWGSPWHCILWLPPPPALARLSSPWSLHPHSTTYCDQRLSWVLSLKWEVTIIRLKEKGKNSKVSSSRSWCLVWLMIDVLLSACAYPYVTAMPHWAVCACWNSCAENCTWRNREDILRLENGIYLSQLRLRVDGYLTKIAIVNIVIIVGHQRLTVGSGYWSSARFFCELLGDFGLRFLVLVIWLDLDLVILVGAWAGPGDQVAAVNTEPEEEILSLDTLPTPAGTLWHSQTTGH